MGSKLVLHNTVYDVPKVLYATSLVILDAKVKFRRRKHNSLMQLLWTKYQRYMYVDPNPCSPRYVLD